MEGLNLFQNSDEDMLVPKNNNQMRRKPKEPLPENPTGFWIKKLNDGNGPTAPNGEMIEMLYTGTFLDGKIFDSSLDKGNPFKFRLGKSQVIKCWDDGVA